MEIFDIIPQMTKWEPFMENEFAYPLKEGEKHTLLLTPYHPIHKTAFIITGIFHITCIDTNFLLDTEIKSIVRLNSNGETPTIQDLYGAYLKARNGWLALIWETSSKRGYDLRLQLPPWTFDMMKPALSEAIYRSMEED